MTLQFDLELAYIARRVAPRALIVAGGMEATFRPELMFELGPFDLVILGEGERPLLELAARLREGRSLDGMTGTVQRGTDGALVSIPQRALSQEELRDAIFSTPYEKMPYTAYWERLEAAYRIGSLPSKAAREAHLAEIRSVRLITLNYCPMDCTFCSATNFLHEAQGSVAGVARLDAAECMSMIERIVAAHPDCAHHHFSGRHLHVYPRSAAAAALRSDRRGEAAGQDSGATAVHQHQPHRCDDRGAPHGDAAGGVSRTGLRHREFLGTRTRGVQ